MVCVYGFQKPINIYITMYLLFKLVSAVHFIICSVGIINPLRGVGYVNTKY